MSLSFQSFVYYRASSTRPRTCFTHFIVISGLLIVHPSQVCSIVFIIGTLVNNQLLLDAPEAWPSPCIVFLVFEQGRFDVPSAVIIYYFILFSVEDYSLHARSGALWRRQYNIIKLVTIRSKQNVASFCSLTRFLQVIRWILVMISSSNAG